MERIFRCHSIPLMVLISHFFFATLHAQETKLKTAPSAAAVSNGLSAEAAKIFAGGIPRSVADLKLMETAQRQLAEKIIPCTVNVRLGQAQGSGVIVSADGYVLTAAHVANRPNMEIAITFPDGKVVRGKTLGLYRTLDAGLAKITDAGSWPFAEMEIAGAVKEGQWCVGTGHPGGFEPGRKPVLRIGRILAVNEGVLVSDCTLVGGDSGGPLFNAMGKVIGIHSRIGGALTANMHVPVKAFHDSWDRLVSADAWGHLPGQIPYIGVRGETDAPFAKITQVFADTPADKAGLKTGDIVTKFGGEMLTNFDSLSKLVANKQPGERIKLEVRRGDETLVLEIVIGRRGG